MSRCKLILLAMIVHLYCGVNSMDSNDSMHHTLTNTTPVMLQNNVSNGVKADDAVHLGEIDLSELMKKCNQSYQIPMNYMEEMNMTGSYPDETEKLPMCFMKCFLENVGALSSDNVVAMQQAVSHFSTNEDVVNSCVTEQKDIDSLDPCEYAYFLARCITMATLVDNRKSDK